MIVTKCAILGASGHGKVIADIAELNGYKVIHFYDDRWPKLTNVEHWAVEGTTESLLAYCGQYDAIFIAIGNNSIRLTKQNYLSQYGAVFPVLVHPSATVSRYSRLGEGCIVMAGSIINPFAVLGKACIVNTSSTVDHDCLLADGVHLSPGSHLAGGVKVGKCTWIGIGANIKQLVNIGENTIVAAGATVIRDVLNDQVVVGVPAKPLI